MHAVKKPLLETIASIQTRQIAISLSGRIMQLLAASRLLTVRSAAVTALVLVVLNPQAKHLAKLKEEHLAQMQAAAQSMNASRYAASLEMNAN